MSEGAGRGMLIPESLYKNLEFTAKRKGVSVEELVLEILLEHVDPKAKADVYLELSEKYLREGEELYRKGELAQAGEKYWGSIVTILKAIAGLRGKDHYSHRDLRVLVNELYREVKDKDILIGFNVAESLHANFYENFMEPEAFEVTCEITLRLHEKLKNLLKEPSR